MAHAAWGSIDSTTILTTHPSLYRFVEYLIKTINNWWWLCEWPTIFRFEFSSNANVQATRWIQNYWKSNGYFCWIRNKQIDESTIQRPRIWPAFLAFILFPPVGLVSFILYKNAIDHIKYRRLRCKQCITECITNKNSDVFRSSEKGLIVFQRQNRDFTIPSKLLSHYFQQLLVLTHILIFKTGFLQIQP